MGHERAIVRLFPNLNRLHLFAVIRLRTLIVVSHELLSMKYQPMAVPDADGISVVQRILLVCRHMAAAIGINSAHTIVGLGDHRRLKGCNDVLAQKRHAQPARMARRGAGADGVELNPLHGLFDPIHHGRVVVRGQFRCRQPVRKLVGVEIEPAPRPGVHPRPIGQVRPIERRSTIGFFHQCLVQLPGRVVLEPFLDHHLLFRSVLCHGELSQSGHCKQESPEASNSSSVYHEKPPCLTAKRLIKPARGYY